jgi:hypothetical protein
MTMPILRASVRRVVVLSGALLTAAQTAQAAQEPAADTAARPGFVLPPGAPVPPPEYRLFEAYFVIRGTQTYTCTDAGTFATTSVPQAYLERYDGRHSVYHSAGPTWTDLVDRSQLLGTVVTRVPSPNGSIDWLLLSTSHPQPGRLDSVAYISRVNTRGGTAPTGACTPGETRAVPTPRTMCSGPRSDLSGDHGLGGASPLTRRVTPDPRASPLTPARHPSHGESASPDVRHQRPADSTEPRRDST